MAISEQSCVGFSLSFILHFARGLHEVFLDIILRFSQRVELLKALRGCLLDGDLVGPDAIALVGVGYLGGGHVRVRSKMWADEGLVNWSVMGFGFFESAAIF